MRFTILLLFTICGLPHFTFSQEPGFINDPDGYTNIRKNQESTSEIIGIIVNGERFLYYPRSNSNWWSIEYNNSEERLTGFVHKSRIKPEYENTNSELDYKKIYHEFKRTTSSFRTSKRNIFANDLPEYYFVETVDNQGRVIDIRFFQGDRIISNQLCYLSPWIKYEYPDSMTIISYNLDSDGSKLSSLECDMWYKTIYTIDEIQQKILETKIEYAIDTAHLLEYGWKKKELLQALKRLKDEVQPQPIMIVGFEKSTAKLNGKFPVSERFELENFSYFGLEYEELRKLFK